MKLQLQGQRLRLRVDEAELARLLAGEEIVNATQLGPGSRFCQSLRLHADTRPMFQSFQGEWRVSLPEASVRGYEKLLPCREALGFQLDCDGGAELSLRFEVDVRDSLQLRGARPRGGASEVAR